VSSPGAVPINNTKACYDLRRNVTFDADHELERYMRSKDCSEVRGYPYKRSHLGRGSTFQDFGERPAIDVVAGREVKL